MLLNGPRAVTSFTDPIRQLPDVARAMIRHPSRGSLQRLLSVGSEKAGTDLNEVFTVSLLPLYLVSGN